MGRRHVPQPLPQALVGLFQVAFGDLRSRLVH
jgi:hypothetical protein